jgi:hypothetical protein
VLNTRKIKWVGVQIDYNVVHLRTSLVQLFVLLQLNFEEVVQIIELRRFGGAPNGYPFAALKMGSVHLSIPEKNQTLLKNLHFQLCFQTTAF